MRRAIITGLALTMALSGCGPVRVEKAAAEVGIDPCSLLNVADVQEVMGRPASGPRMRFILEPYSVAELRRYDVVNNSRFCWFDIPPETGLPTVTPNQVMLNISVADRGWSESEVRAEFEADAKEEDPPTPVEGLGRVAVTRSYGGDLSYRELRVLGEQGLFLRLDLGDWEQPDPALALDRATRLLRRALKRAEASFPGDPDALPQPPQASADVCALLDADDAAAVYSKPPNSTPNTYTEGPGPLGSSWSCSWRFGQASISALVNERAPSAQQMKAAGGTEIKGLSGLAFEWKPAEPVWPRAVVVIVSNGRLITINAEQRDGSIESLRDLVQRQARTAALRLVAVES